MPDKPALDTAVEAATEVLVRPANKPKGAKPKQPPKYHVILWNDEAHTYHYVIRMLFELFRHPPERGYQLACEVDTKGKCICLTTTKEHAELKRDQIHAYGKDTLMADCLGSMFSSIEPEA